MPKRIFDYRDAKETLEKILGKGAADRLDIELLENIAEGMTIETEHSWVGKNPEAALRVAMEHLVERSDYYKRLKKAGIEGLRRAARGRKTRR